MSEVEFSEEFLARLQSVKGKRARIVVNHILENGSVTTEELEQLYGYKHPPRAAKDVRDQGIPLETFTVRSSDSRAIAAYRFGDPSNVVKGRIGGRTAFSRKFKLALHEKSDGKCSICGGEFAIRELQIDHRVPYEIAGDVDYSENNIEAYILLCGSCNRAKSWSCEHCPNWIEQSPTKCRDCYWTNPLEYKHVSLREVRRTDILWEKQEVLLHDRLNESASASQLSIQAYIKQLLKGISLFLLGMLTILACVGFFTNRSK